MYISFTQSSYTYLSLRLTLKSSNQIITVHMLDQWSLPQSLFSTISICLHTRYVYQYRHLFKLGFQTQVLAYNPLGFWVNCVCMHGELGFLGRGCYNSPPLQEFCPQNSLADIIKRIRHSRFIFSFASYISSSLSYFL